MKNKTRLFDIATLSDCIGCDENYNSSYTSLSEPIAILTGGIAILQSIFPNLFGGGRRPLTSADWIMMFPGNGNWTVRLRMYLSEHIHYDADLPNIAEFSRYFVDENKTAICGINVAFNDCYQQFLQIIEQEKFSGGTLPIGSIPGMPGTFNYAALMPWLIGGLALAFIMKKKK